MRWWATLAGVTLIVGLFVATVTLSLTNEQLVSVLNRADFVSLTLTAAALIATVAALAFAVLGWYHLTNAERIVERQTRQALLDFRKQLAQEHTKIQEATQKIISGYDLLNKGRVDQAIELFQQAITVFPEAFNGYTALGYAYLAKNEPLKAIEAFHEAISVFPDRKEPYFDLARLYVNQEDNVLAMRYLERAIDVDHSSLRDILEDDFFDVLKHDPAVQPRYEKLVSSAPQTAVQAPKG